jgi:hypothetical protein
VDKSGFGAPFATATPIDDLAISTALPVDQPALRDQIAPAVGGHDRDVGCLAFADLLLEPQRWPEGDVEPVARRPLECRRQLLEHHLHRRGAEHLDVDRHVAALRRRALA